MKLTFKEYYRIEGEVAKQIWENGIIVVDANILLNLYRYSKETSDDVLGVLEHLKERLWLPYQVCFEFHENRLDRYYDSWSASDTIKDMLSSHMDKFINEVRNKFSRNPFVDIDDLEKIVHNNVKRIDKKLDARKPPVYDFVEVDYILDRLSSLYEGKVGDDYDEERLKSIFKEGEVRYKEKRPPGFEDDTPQKQVKGKRYVYGDLIIWKQVIDEAKKRKKDVVFVSDDQKKDWWLEWKGKKIYPQPCLIREFGRETNGQRIIFYNQKNFLNFAHSVLEMHTDESTIREIEAVEEDQRRERTSLFDVPYLPQSERPRDMLDYWHEASSPAWGSSSEYRALSGLTNRSALTGLTASQEILQSALRISEIAKPFAYLEENTTEGILSTKYKPNEDEAFASLMGRPPSFNKAASSILNEEKYNFHFPSEASLSSNIVRGNKSSNSGNSPQISEAPTKDPSKN